MTIYINGTSGISGVDGSSSTPALQGTDSNTGISFPAADTVAINTGGSERSRVDSSGRLLVGTSSESTSGTPKLVQVVDPGGAAIGLGRTTATSISNNFFLGGLDFLGAGLTPSAHIYCYADADQSSTSDLPSRLEFFTTADGASSPTERMRIKNNGESWITPTLYGLVVSSATGAGTTYTLYEGLYSGGSVGSGTLAFRVFSNGNVQNANNSYAGTSDIKLKENIVDASSQWGDLKALRVRKYNFKEGQTHTQIGLIAQEAELVSPGLVFESPDRDAEGNDLGTVTKSVNYSVLYMKAVKALQEAMERIEQLEAEMAEVKAQLS